MKTSRQNASLFTLFPVSTIRGMERNLQNFAFFESVLFAQKTFWLGSAFHAPLNPAPLNALEPMGPPPPASLRCGFHVNWLKPEPSWAEILQSLQAPSSPKAGQHPGRCVRPCPRPRGEAPRAKSHHCHLSPGCVLHPWLAAEVLGCP